MNVAILVAGSLGAIAVIFGSAIWLGLGRTAQIVNEAQARQIACDNHYDFTAASAVVDRTGAMALVRDGANRHVLIKAYGANFATRLLVPPIGGRLDHEILTLTAPDGAFGVVTLDLGDRAQDWARGLLGGP